MRIGNIKIGTRLLLGITCIIVLFSGVVLMQILKMNTLGVLQDAGAKRGQDVIAIMDIDKSLGNFAMLLTDAVIDLDFLEFERQLPKEQEIIRKNVEIVHTLVDTPEETKLAEQLNNHVQDLFTFIEKELIPALGRADANELKKINEQIDERAEEAMQPLRLIVDSLKNEMVEADEEFDGIRKNAITLALAIAGIALVMGFGFAWLLSRSIRRPIEKALEVANTLASGDLTLTFANHTRDELGQLLDAMQTMVEKLKEVVGDVVTAAENVASGSQEMSSTAQQMSQGATEQAASAEEISASMEEMASNIRQNTDNALQTEKIAVKSAADAQDGGKAVTETVSAMKQIATKISIIEEIARQTNPPRLKRSD